MSTQVHPASAREDLCVSRVPIFKNLSYEDQLKVASVANQRQVSRGDTVQAAGSSDAELMVVHTGTVKVFRIDSEGREQILRIIGPGDFLGESQFLTGRRPTQFAEALDAGSMCVFRHEDLQTLVEEYPLIGLKMLQDVSQRLEQTEARLVSVTSDDVAARVAAYLLSLDSRPTNGEILVSLPIAKKDIASVLGTTPETLSRHLRRLQDQGVIENRSPREIAILDVDALIALAED
ncbi:Crp/Fnr family transcriptional regulator [Gulosibacter molinativorax]|uniref:Crp/Fnr family transcriptional regulator n=1 Tax=Gulosibacter molinativorax TaxID=256821 RepID=A0ABT7CAW1_9MICO|nr:Crp/Fnr family transcriptional regulator [Gulosibacter molinativorax]MDJ1372324.1 Crp/Fnr family transcriptional regulator [Gulosibacter molinativorax]QUY63418.1 Global nitrogen regulator NtcA [Gulosibacter molinativorax]